MTIDATQGTAAWTAALDGAASGVAPSKVLFFSHDAKLGDAIVNTAFVAGLRQHAPQYEIHATVAGVTTGFWGGDARVATLWPFQKPGWLDVIRTGLALRRQRFDYIVTWRKMRSEKNRLLLWLARPGTVIDLRAYNLGGVQHQIESCREALVQMDQRYDIDLAYDISVTARGRQLPHPALLLPAAQELIVVNLFAADHVRTIPLAEACAILQGLKQSAPQALLCLVCMDQTRAAAAQALECSGVAGQLVNCEGSLNRLFDLCGRADLIISPDTALIHVASALDTPVIGIYQNNGIQPVQWAPRSRLHALVLSTSAHGIAGFSVAQVLAHAEHLRAAYRAEHAAPLSTAAGVPTPPCPSGR